MYYLLNAVRRFRGSAIDVHDEKVIEELTRAEGESLLTAQNVFYDSWLYTLTESGRDKLQWPSSTRKKRMFTNGADDAKRAMWDWMLMNGGGPSQYSGEGFEVYDSGYLHVLACGLDIDKCSEVRDGSWSVFLGTFVEDGEYKGLVGRATCRCGEVEDEEVRGTVESLARLIREITS